MKNLSKIFLILLFALFSCKNKEVRKEVKTDDSTLILKEETQPAFSKNDYEHLYSYSQGEDTQLLGLNIIDNNTIKFHLVTKTLPCDTEHWGTAKNKTLSADGEVDNDEGKGYYIHEYLKEESDYSIGIRLDSGLSKVQIRFIQKDSLDTDCLPIDNQIMRRMK